MDIILLERVPKLGQMGDQVSVKNGYARNHLLPQGKALRSSPENVTYFKTQRQELETRNLELKSEAEKVGEKIKGQMLVLLRSASEIGSLYGSVTTRDIADAASVEGVSINRQQIELKRPIKSLGIYDVSLILHPEITVGIKVNVARTHEEAQLQEKGEDVTVIDADKQNEGYTETLAKSAREETADVEEKTEDQDEPKEGLKQQSKSD